MGTFNLHFSKVKQSGSFVDAEWTLWLAQFTAVFNGTYHTEVANTPYFLMYGREYNSHLSTVVLAEVYASRKLGSLTMEQYLVKFKSYHDKAVEVVRARFVSRRQFLELERALSDDVPHFEPDALVLLQLGDSNGGFVIKNRCHAGPFKVIRRVSNSNYLIAGGDEEAVMVHGFKLCTYVPTLADVNGTSVLAASAVGAAQARLLNFENNDPSLE
jgi:hypothetical protein